MSYKLNIEDIWDLVYQYLDKKYFNRSVYIYKYIFKGNTCF